MVEDQAAISVPGALVALSGPALVNGPQQTEADADGAFQFADLAPGEYAVRVEMQGFSYVTMFGVDVVVGKTTHLTVEMPPDAVVLVTVGPGFLFSNASSNIATIPQGILYGGACGARTAERLPRITCPTALLVNGAVASSVMDRSVSDALDHVPGFLARTATLAGAPLSSVGFRVDGVVIDRSGFLSP